jgi:hypothetical protein
MNLALVSRSGSLTRVNVGRPTTFGSAAPVIRALGSPLVGNSRARRIARGDHQIFLPPNQNIHDRTSNLRTMASATQDAKSQVRLERGVGCKGCTF